MSEYGAEQQAQPLEAQPIPFGGKPHQVLRRDVVEAMLRDLFSSEPLTFAHYMARAYGVDEVDIRPAPAPKRGRSRGTTDAP